MVGFLDDVGMDFSNLSHSARLCRHCQSRVIEHADCQGRSTDVIGGPAAGREDHVATVEYTGRCGGGKDNFRLKVYPFLVLSRF